LEYRKLGRFHIEGLVSQGGMGEIVRSMDDSGRPVALKTILREFEHDAKFRDLFMREAEITFQLDHPNIIQAYKFETIGNKLVLALEYLDGINLKDLLRRIYDKKLQIPFILVAAIMRRVLVGLDYAHKKKDSEGEHLGIIHRDLNPSNIFITYTGEVKILDFGISKALHKDVHQLTPKGELRGKMCYLSPEQIRGKTLDHRSDIFACGIVMWELLTGRPLFLRDTDGQVMEAIAHTEYVPAQTLRPDIPKELDDLISRALQQNPRHRFDDCAQFVRALDAAIKRTQTPGAGEEEISIFIRTIFKIGMEEADANFMAGYAWLLTQIPGQQESGVALAKKLAIQHPTRPYVQLNVARCLIATGDKLEGMRTLKRLLRSESLQEISQEMMEWLGVRRPPVLKFLTRSNPINHALGRIRHKVLGPTPFQNQFMAA
jgi:serine/threonine protein kinase